MKNLRNLLAISLALVINHAYGQDRTKLYFLVDTVNIPKENRIVDIRKSGDVIYTFYCRCLVSKQDIRFSCLDSKAKTTSMKPAYTYISWKKLLDLIDNDLGKFEQKYELFITEVVRKNKYKTNRVYSDIPTSSVDYVIIKE